MGALINRLLVGIGIDDRALRKGSKLVNKNINGLARNITKVGAGVALIGAGLAAGAFASAITTVNEFDQGVANLAATSGKTKTEISGLVQNAKAVGSVSAFSATEVLELQTELAKLGNTEGQIISMTKAVGDFSIAVGATAADAATLTGGALKSFGKNANDTTALVNTLAVATTKSALDFNKLNIALPIVGTAADQSGVSFERTTALLGVLSDRNIDASTSGTALRNIFLDLKDKGLSYEEAMSQINGSTDKLNTANKLFGKRGAVVATVLAESGDAADKLEASITGVSGALDKMTKTRLDTAQGKTILLKSAWEGLVLSLDSGGGVVSRAYKGVLDNTTSLLTTLTDIERLDPAKESVRQKTELDALLKSLIKNNDNYQIRGALINELNEKYSKYLKNIDLEKLGIDGVNGALLKYDELNDRKIKTLINEQKRNDLLKKQDSLVRKVIDAEIQLQNNIAKDKAGVIFKGLTSASRKAVELYREELEGVTSELKTLAGESAKVRKRGEGASIVLTKVKSLSEVIKNDNETSKSLGGGGVIEEVKTFATEVSRLEGEMSTLSETFIKSGGNNKGILSTLTEKATEVNALNAQLEKTSTLTNKIFGKGEKIEAPAAIGSSGPEASGAPTLEEGFVEKALADFAAQEAATDSLIQKQQLLKETYQSVGEALGSSLAAGAASFQQFAVSALQSIKKVIGGLIQQYVATYLLEALKGTGILGVLAAPAIGGLAAGIFNTAISSAVPALAEGGVVSGPRIVQVGEYAGASSNPEIIAPERKLTNIFSSVLAKNGGGGGGEIFGKLAGNDLLLSSRRETRLRKRKSTT